MFGCDYNGWVDLPEEEREELEAYEFEQQHPANPTPTAIQLKLFPSRMLLPLARAA